MKTDFEKLTIARLYIDFLKNYIEKLEVRHQKQVEALIKDNHDLKLEFDKQYDRRNGWKKKYTIAANKAAYLIAEKLGISQHKAKYMLKKEIQEALNKPE